MKKIWMFFLVVTVFFYPVIFHRKIPVPSDTLVGLYHPWRDAWGREFPRGMPFKNFLITDPVRQQIPWRKIAIDQWKEWKSPRWNPFNFSGVTLAANIQSGVFYPLNILFFILPIPIAWTALIVLQPLLAGLFIYLFLRNLKLSEWASLLGALIWSFSGFSIAWLTWGTMMHTALWLPLSLWAIDKKKSCILIFALAAMIFAGHLQIALYGIILVLLYALWKKMNIRTLSLVIVITGFITLIQWLPFIEFIVQAGRLAEKDSWIQSGWFLPWQHLTQFVAPDFFGNPATLNYWGIWNYGEFIGYVGILSLMFVLSSLLSKNKETFFWKLVIIVSLMFILPNPISKLPYQLHLPIFSVLQPTRLMALICFSLAVLAAYGFDGYLKQPKKSIMFLPGLFLSALWIVTIIYPNENMIVARRNLIFPTALFVAGSALLFFPKKILTLLAAVIVTFDLLRFGWKFTPFTDIKYFFPQTETITFLQNQKEPFRVVSMDAKIFPPNTLAYFGIESIEGYDPIILRRYEEFIAASERGEPNITPPFGFNRIITPHNLDSPLLPIMNVRFVVSSSEIIRPYLKQVFIEGETRVYEDTRSLPRAYFAERVLFEPDKQKVLAELFDQNSVSTVAVVEKPVSVISWRLTAEERVNLISYIGDRLELDVSTVNPRLLVITNTFYPGWKATIDGKRVDIYRVNYLFQGVVVPEGKHTVNLWY